MAEQATSERIAWRFGAQTHSASFPIGNRMGRGRFPIVRFVSHLPPAARIRVIAKATVKPRRLTRVHARL